MAMTKDQILTEALALEPREREQLAEELLRGLSDADDEPTDAAWLAEARRRDAEFVASGGKTIPVDEAIARLTAGSRE